MDEQQQADRAGEAGATGHPDGRHQNAESGPDLGAGGPEGDAPPARTRNTGSAGEGLPKPQMASIEDLIRSAYESRARLLELSKGELRKLPVDDAEIASQSALVAELAPKDPVLAVPFKLLQYVAWQGVDLRRAQDVESARVLIRLRDLSLVAMSHHPVFATWTDQLADPSREPTLTSQYLREEACVLDPAKLGLTGEEFKQAARDRLVRNTVACFGLLRSLQCEWTPARFIDDSYEFCWRYEVPSAASRERIVGTIAATRDLEVLGLVADNYTSRIDGLDRRVAELERQLEAAGNREARLKDQLEEAANTAGAANTRAEAFSADIVRLKKELAAEQDNRVVDKSHMADDYETLRTRIIRRLGGEIDLLTDGLHALRNGSTGVAEEFLDRSLLALTREVEQLKDAAGGLG